jgi:hypothetical protein
LGDFYDRARTSKNLNTVAEVTLLSGRSLRKGARERRKERKEKGKRKKEREKGREGNGGALRD